MQVELHVHIHVTGPSDSPVRVDPARTKQAFSGAQRSYNFALALRDRPHHARVHAIVNHTRSPQWGDAFLVARSDT